MQLELSREEASDLGEVLEAYLRQLLGEISHSDTLSATRLLRAKYDRLDRVRRELDRMSGRVPSTDVGPTAPMGPL